MDWENIERELKSSQEAEQYPINTDALWNSVRPHIPQPKKKNRFVLWIWGGLSVAAVIILFGAMWNGSVEKIKIDSDPTYANQKTEQLTSPVNSGESISDESRTATSSNKIHQDNTSSKSIQSTSGLMNSGEHTPSDQRTSNSVQNNYNTSSYSKSTFTKISDNHSSAIIDESDLLAQHQSPLVTGENISYQSDRIESKSITLINIDQLFKNSMNPLPIDQRAFNLPNWAPTKMVNPFKKKKNLWFIELAGGLTYGHSQLSLTNPDATSIFESRKTAERSLLSYSARANIGYQINNNWSVMTGIRYATHYKESFKTIQFLENVNLADAVVQEIYSVNGLQVVRADLDLVQQVNRTTKRISSFKMLELPLSIMYRQRLGGINLELGTGIAGSINTIKKGYIHPYEDREYDIAIDDESWFATQTMLSTHAFLGISYPLNSNMELISRVGYQHYLSGINDSNLGIKESLSNYMLEFGTKINL